MASHECPADGCTRPVPANMLMCRPDWYRVPAPLRRAVYSAWSGGKGAGTPAHQAAMDAAIRAANKARAEPPPVKPTEAEVIRSIFGDHLDHGGFEQAGRCVYCKCGHRLYQGTKPSASDVAAFKAALAKG